MSVYKIEPAEKLKAVRNILDGKLTPMEKHEQYLAA